MGRVKRKGRFGVVREEGPRNRGGYGGGDECHGDGGGDGGSENHRDDKDNGYENEYGKDEYNDDGDEDDDGVDVFF